MGQWEHLYACIQRCAIAAKCSGNQDRERAFLDILIIMDRWEPEAGEVA